MADFEDINKIVFNLLTFRRGSSKATTYFKGKKHNKDLCPLLKEQLEKIHNSFNKFKKITYDIQGVRDNGTDVLIKDTSTEPSRYICFQIKNEDDFKRGDCLKELKAQYFDSKTRFGNILNYYIFLCADIYTDRSTINDKGLKDKSNISLNKQAQLNYDMIRNITAEFSTESSIFVIEPTLSYTFLNMNLMQIDAIVKSIFGNEDIVYQNAIDISSSLVPLESAILYFMIYDFITEQKLDFELQEIESSSILSTICNDIPDYNRYYYDTTIEEIRKEFEDDFESDLDKVSFELLKQEAEDTGIFTDGLSKLEIIEELFQNFIIENYTDNRTSTERIYSALSFLEENYINQTHSGVYSLSVSAIKSIIVLEVDAMERYGYSGKELIDYMLDLLNKLNI